MRETSQATQQVTHTLDTWVSRRHSSADKAHECGNDSQGCIWAVHHEFFQHKPMANKLLLSLLARDTSF